MKKVIMALALLLWCGIAEAQKWEGLAQTPQMGWSSWNKFQGNINEAIIKEMADAMVSSGLRDAGYIYINLDDCWHGKRDADGFIQADEKRFPHGIKWLADYVHAKGLKLGIYSDCGTETCAGMPGSLGHEYQDALQYARWGVDYLKEDWCNTTNVNPVGAYQLMSDALRASGRPIFLSMCEWGANKPWRWARDIGHSWRIGPDIWCSFDSTRVFPTYVQYSVMDCIHKNDTLRQYAGPGHWNDPDMLEVGNGMSVNEDRAHFSMWCMMASPLILGNDLRNMSAETKEILLNAEMIAIDQDKLGVQGLHHCSEQGLDFWFKPLANGDWAMTVLNPTKNDVSYALNWQRMDLTDDKVSKRSTRFDKEVYKVRNLWTHRYEGKTSTKDKAERTLVVKAHDVVCYRLITSHPYDTTVTPAENLRHRLAKLQKQGIMVGHQDDPFYGTTWKWEQGRSDVKEVCGDYPAVMGFELGCLELDSARNLDGVPFELMRTEIANQYRRGGVVTISWHAQNPVTDKNAWDPSGHAVKEVLPGGSRHKLMMKWIGRVADFLLSLRDDEGNAIPVIFRPWHEMSGGWFWWGSESCTPEEYKQLYRLTIDGLRARGVNNCLWAYSPGGNPNETDDNFMRYYPGDSYVDLIGVDLYGNEGTEKYVREMKQELDVVCRVAKQHGKLPCVAETGSRNTPDPRWFTDGMWAAIHEYPVSYVLLWRNAWDQPTENFGPAPEKSCADNFRALYKKKRALFANDIQKTK
jgi:alpha-galactosidase